jgi:hypothetical protein
MGAGSMSENSRKENSLMKIDVWESMLLWCSIHMWGNSSGLTLRTHCLRLSKTLRWHHRLPNLTRWGKFSVRYPIAVKGTNQHSLDFWIWHPCLLATECLRISIAHSALVSQEKHNFHPRWWFCRAICLSPRFVANDQRKFSSSVAIGH